jgi:hypothetical protein
MGSHDGIWWTFCYRTLSLGLALSLLCASASLLRKRSADYGGNRGWALGFQGVDDFASVKGHFSAESYWPQYAITGRCRDRKERDLQ